jgi:hypothetical protein
MSEAIWCECTVEGGIPPPPIGGGAVHSITGVLDSCSSETTSDIDTFCASLDPDCGPSSYFINTFCIPITDDSMTGHYTVQPGLPCLEESGDTWGVAPCVPPCDGISYKFLLWSFAFCFLL